MKRVFYWYHKKQAVNMTFFRTDDDEQTVRLCEEAILIKLMYSGHTALEIKEKL